MSTYVQDQADQRSPASSHFVRFYQDDVALLAEVGEFIDQGLRAGGSAVVIATREHASALQQQLVGLGSLRGQTWPPERFVLLDAEETLASFMVNDWPDKGRFDATVGRVVRDACAHGEAVHAFGEMVALLCTRGLYDAAVQLEAL